MLERVACHGRDGGDRFDVLVVEPKELELGVGVHWRDQPEYLILNTVASQATAFSDEHMVAGAPASNGPDFATWSRAQGLRTAADRPVGSGDYLPRRIWGEYLAWSASRILATLPATVSVTVLAGVAVDVRPGGHGATVTLADGNARDVDVAFVTTGHGVRRAAPVRAPRLITDPFPLPDTVAAVNAGETVAIAGMGLTAIDVVAALTVGRAGRFTVGEGTVRYEASGHEPRIVLFSRTGWLPCARPTSPRQVPKPGARHFTIDALRAVRDTRADGRLDFRFDVLPLVQREVLSALPAGPAMQAARNTLGLGRSTWETVTAYEADVIAQARWDLAEARCGLSESPFKNQMEVLRDARETLRAVVHPPGLTLQGHRDFFDTVPALANRAAVGPQIERLAELLALIEAGVVALGPGPNPLVEAEGEGWTLRATSLLRGHRVAADHLITAHLDWPRSVGGEDYLASPIRTWARPHPADPRFLDLTPGGFVQAVDGLSDRTVVVLGPPAEGATYYNNYVLWPRAWSRALTDIDRALASVRIRR